MTARMRVPLTVLFATALPAQQEPFDAPAAVARFRWLENGEYQRTQHGVAQPGKDDVALCLCALESGNELARSHACLALEAMTREPFFRELPPAMRQALLAPLFATLGSSNDDTAEWGARALSTLAADSKLVDDKDVRALLVQGLALVLTDDAEARRRAGFLLERITPRLQPADHLQVARTVQLALDRYPRAKDESERVAIARTVLCGVLAHADVGDPHLANELAGRCLADLAGNNAFGIHYERSDALRGLGRWFPLLHGESRTRAFAALLAATGDPKLQFMTTSGRRTPFRHHGHEALAAAAPALSVDELARAEAAVDAARKRAIAAGVEAMDVAGMFDPVQKALAARRESLAK